MLTDGADKAGGSAEALPAIKSVDFSSDNIRGAKISLDDAEVYEDDDFEEDDDEFDVDAATAPNVGGEKSVPRKKKKPGWYNSTALGWKGPTASAKVVSDNDWWRGGKQLTAEGQKQKVRLGKKNSSCRVTICGNIRQFAVSATAFMCAEPVLECEYTVPMSRHRAYEAAL